MVCVCVSLLSIFEGCPSETPSLPTLHHHHLHHTRRFHATLTTHAAMEQQKGTHAVKVRQTTKPNEEMHGRNNYKHVHEKRDVEGRTKKRRKEEKNQQHTDVDQPAPNPYLGRYASYPSKIPWKHERNNKNEHPIHALKSTKGPDLEETKNNKGRRGHPKNGRVQTSTSSSPRRRPETGSCTGKECEKENPNLLGNEERRQETRACTAKPNEG